MKPTSIFVLINVFFIFTFVLYHLEIEINTSPQTNDLRITLDNKIIQQNVIDVLLSCDSEERPGLYALINSILLHTNSSNIIYFHLLVENNSELIMIEKELNLLFTKQLNSSQFIFEIKAFDEYPQFYQFVKNNARRPASKYQQHSHSVMTYAQLYLAEIFVNVEKAIFSDIDIVFQTDIFRLYQHETTTRMIWSVFPDDGTHKVRYLFTDNTSALQHVGIFDEWTNDDGGFNTGIYLFNLTTWRRYKLTQKSEDIMIYNRYLKDNFLNFQDQSILYIVFRQIEEQVGRLNTKWNVLHLGWKRIADYTHRVRSGPNLTMSRVNEAYVLHWCGASKPWLKSNHLNYRLWKKYIPKYFNNQTIQKWNSNWISYDDQFNKWSIDLNLIHQISVYRFKPALKYNFDVSDIISFNNYNSPKQYYCGSQYYRQSIKNAIQVQDIILQTDQKTLWILFVKYGVRKREFNQITTKYKFMLCAYSDGTTLRSHKITMIHKWKLYGVVECDIPTHLIPYIITTNKYTNVSVSIIAPFLYQNEISSVSISLPVCSKWEMNIMNKNTNTDTTTMWNSITYDNYKYDLVGCVLIHELDHYEGYDKLQFILRDWIEYNMAILGIQHIIFYQHIIPSTPINDIKMKQSIVFNILLPYIELGKATYIPWYNELIFENSFYFSMVNSALKRFGHTKFAKYLMYLDIDKYIISKSNYKHFRLLNLIQKTHNTFKNDHHIYAFELFCNQVYVCKENILCSKNNKSQTKKIASIVEALKFEMIQINGTDIFIAKNTTKTIIYNSTTQQTN